MTQHLSIGIGCSSRATSSDIIHLIKSCIAEMLPEPLPASGTLLATLDRCASLGEVVATALGFKLVSFSADALGQVPGITVPSALALDKVGTSSVAEAAALATLGPRAELLLPRRTGHLCTCAVAVTR